LKEAHKAQDLDRIDAASQKLNDAWQAASQDLYQATQEANAQNGGAADPNAAAGDNAGGGEGNTDDVTDVEFEEVDDKK